MTAGRRARSLRFKLFLLLAGPLLVALSAGLGDWPFPGGSSSDASDLSRREERLTRWVDHLLGDVSRIAALALDDSPRGAWAEVQRGSPTLRRRVEGLGVVGAGSEFVAWEGTPPPAPPAFTDPRSPDWWVRVDGVRTRLLARAGPDARGRSALVSFIVDSTLDDLSAERSLPDGLRRGVRIEFEFGAEPGGGAPPPGIVPLRSPDGDRIGVATITPAAPDRRARRVGQIGRAWSALLFSVLLAFLFDWVALARRAAGLPLVALAIVAGRGVLLWQHVTSRLLPRDLGAPSLYGSPKLGGLLQSPADLLLTGVALYLLCLAVRGWCMRPDGRGALERWVAALSAAAATTALAAFALSVARNSRVPLLERPAPFEWDPRLALWLALAFPLLGASALWATAWACRRTGGPPLGRFAAAPLAIALVALAAGTNLLLQHCTEAIAIEQLDSELAPLVLEQATRRRLALTEAMRQVLDDPPQAEPIRAGAADGLPFLAYERWVESELFHGRYKSSLDFYDSAGDPVSHFGFGLPPLDETIPSFEPAPDVLEIRAEWIEETLAQPRLLHAEAPLEEDGEVVGYVVAHILDEPDNLPFLPWAQIYLAALGPGVPRTGPPAPGGELHYVLYGGFGEVRVTTLLQPPPETDALREAAATGETTPVTAGDRLYVARALEDVDGRLHLLLLPQWTLAERLGAIVRFALLGLLLLAVFALAGRALRPGGLRGLLPALRGSFYRKLLAALLLASIVPLVGLALFLRAYLERRGDEALIASATQFVSAAQRVVEDYTASAAGEPVQLSDAVLYWLRGIVGQEIHVYRDGRLQASSTRELFDSGLLPPRLDGEVQRRLVDGGLPYVVVPMSIGPSEIPVAYAPVRRPQDPAGRTVVAVPLVLEERQIARALSRVAEMTLLATVALVGLLAVTAALLARTVARPVRDLVAATGRIAAGDYGTRLEPETEDEIAELVGGFNTMAAALGRQRADIERRRDYIETLLLHATIGVVSLDTEGRVVTLNPAATELLQAAAPRVGDVFHHVLSESKESEPLGRELARARSGEPVDVDLPGDVARRLRGVRVELRRADGESFGTLILLEDITELMRSNQLAAWAEMARAIAHEIKNPLTPIQLSTEHLGRLLGDRTGGPTAEERDCLDTIIKQVRALYEIAGEFSAYAKLPALAPEPTDPVEFMRGVVAPYRAAQPAGLVIDERYEPAPAIAADRRVLARAVVNLIENALQAMPGGGTLTLGVAGGAPHSCVELSVADTGPGLVREVRRRLFEPYFSTKSAGTGLGLAIVRRAVEAHGGTIDVSSASDRGTVFRLRIPVSAV